MTFHTKMGDCKDMSLLLVALLREAGKHCLVANSIDSIVEVNPTIIHQ